MLLAVWVLMLILLLSFKAMKPCCRFLSNSLYQSIKFIYPFSFNYGSKQQQTSKGLWEHIKVYR